MTNTMTSPEQVDAANPRADNRHGHILELTPPNGDHSASKYRWEILVQCGDPSVAAIGSTFNPLTSTDGWFSNPDNCAFDAMGRLWISTDGNSDDFNGRNDGIWAVDTEGPARGTSSAARPPTTRERTPALGSPHGAASSTARN